MKDNEASNKYGANSFLLAEPLFLKTAAFVLAVLYIVFLNPHLDIRGFNATDSAAYLARTQSMLKGYGYGEKFVEIFYPVTIQSPVFSVFLMPAVAMFGMQFTILKIYMLLFAFAFAVAMYFFFAYFLENRNLALPATLLVLASPPIFGLSHRVLSDIPYALFSCLGLLALDQLLKTLKTSWLLLAASFACITIAYGLKQTAVAIFVGGALLLKDSSCRKLRAWGRFILCVGLVLIPIYLWKKWCDSIPAVGYWAQPFNTDWKLVNPYDPNSAPATLMDLATRVRHNIVWGLGANIGILFIAPLYFMQSHVLAFLVSVPLILLLAWRWVLSLFKNPSVLEGFVMTTLIALAFKFEGSAIRYTAVLYPAMAVYAFRGIFENPSGIKWKAALYKVALVGGIIATIVTAVDQWKNPYGTPLFSDYVAIAETAREKLNASDLCAAPAPTHWQLLTGHNCFDSHEEAELLSGGGKNPNYFIGFSKAFPRDISGFIDFEARIAKETMKLSTIIEENPALFEEAGSNSTFAIYKKVRV